MGSARGKTSGRLAAAVGLIYLAFASGASQAFAANLTLSATSAKQGQTIVVTVLDDSPEGALAPVKFNGQDYVLFPRKKPSSLGEAGGRQYLAFAEPAENGAVVEDYASCAAQIGAAAGEAISPGFATLLAVPADLKPGRYEVRYGTLSRTLVVTSGQFAWQRLRLPPSRATFAASPGEQEAVEAAKASLSDTRLWTGRFQAPVKSRVSAGFGLRRIVNGKVLSDYFHSGFDYAAPQGTPVKAVADGKVVLAATGYRLHGNTVCLDHGQGVVSFYIHLQKVLVKKGQLVKTGDVIGRVGQTGRANGPHLHFSIYVNKVAANPYYWYSQSF